MKAALLDDRGVIEVGGADAGSLLQRLVTNNVLDLAAGDARYTALLTPQGKILADFLVVGRAIDGNLDYLLDCPLALAPDLARKLTQYRLRAEVTITNGSASLGVAAFWPEAPQMPEPGQLVYRDPRSESLGFRMIASHAALAGAVADADAVPALYTPHRIMAGIPEGGTDFGYGDTFPHEANLDRLHGLDFTKGCYVGQEVVSRVEHRGSARKRVAMVSFEGGPPPLGADVTVGEIAIGTMGSTVEGHGLAMMRTDRAAEAAALGAPITCDGIRLMIAAA